MGHIEGEEREQIRLISLEGLVGAESMARVIEKFIEVTDLGKLGFTRVESSRVGRSSYPAAALTKL